MKTVLITGTSSGIGKETVELFLDKGHRVIATLRNPQKAESFGWKKKYGNQIELLPLDLNSSQSIQNLVSTLKERNIDIDILVNNAGFGYIGAMVEYNDAELKDQFQTNFFGLWELTTTLLPAMMKKNSGTIISLSSIGGKMSFPYFGAYNATKHALEAIMESLQLELYNTNIKVKLIEPGFTQTKFATHSMKNTSYQEEFFQKEKQELKTTMEQGTTGSSPKVIAESIYKAAQDKSNKLRFSAGKHAGVLLFAKRFFPSKLFSYLILKRIQVPKK